MGSEMSSEEAEIEIEEAKISKESKEIVESEDIVYSDNLPGREDGDGMELPADPPKSNSPLLETLAPNTIVSDLLVCTSVELPGLEKNLSLEKLPPPRDQKFIDLSPPPKPLIAEKKIKVYPKGSLPPSVKKQREPKFVPYEPYKGAVAAMENRDTKGKLNISRGNSVEKEASGDFNSSDIYDVPPENEDSNDMNTNFDRNYQLMMEIKEKELESLRNKVEESEKQLKIQLKVNAEVKKLLVASVGEDIEARVDFLTQDKARLAADVIQYNNRIASDFEEKEALGVESDVWKSKFLASTVIVEELTKKLSATQTRGQQVEHAARKVLLQGGTLRDRLARVQAVVDKINKAFDPLSKVVAPGNLDTLTGCQHLDSSVEALSRRLLGEAQPSLEVHGVPAGIKESQAEADLRRQLGEVGEGTGESLPTDVAASLLAKDARLHLLKLEDRHHEHQGKDGFKNCGHCSGTVQVV